jgi:hypothetical protein
VQAAPARANNAIAAVDRKGLFIRVSLVRAQPLLR